MTCLFTYLLRCTNGHIFQYAPIGARLKDG